MVEIIAWPKVPDHELEKMGNEYRNLCGSNDVLIRSGRIVPFECFVATRMVAEAIARKIRVEA